MTNRLVPLGIVTSSVPLITTFALFEVRIVMILVSLTSGFLPRLEFRSITAPPYVRHTLYHSQRQTVQSQRSTS